MKKFIKYILLIILLITLTGCSLITNDKEIKKYEVTYIVDGEVYLTETVNEGEKLKEPSLKLDKDLSVRGWFNDGKKWDFKNDIVNSDLTLEAKYGNATFTVYFENPDDFFDGSISVFPDEDVILESYEKEGYEFLGWMDDEGNIYKNKISNIDKDYVLNPVLKCNNCEIAYVFGDNNSNYSENDLDVYNGIKNYSDYHNIKYNYYFQKGKNIDDNTRMSALYDALSDETKIVLVNGISWTQALYNVALENPEVLFIYPDGEDVDLFNVFTYKFKFEELGFLAGYLSVIEGYKNIALTCGGDGSNEDINRYVLGFVQGMNNASSKTIDKPICTVNYLYDPKANEEEHIKHMEEWLDNGVDLIFACGEGFADNVITAINNKGTGKVITTDFDDTLPDYNIIIGRACRMYEAAIFNIINNYYNDINKEYFKHSTTYIGVDIYAVQFGYNEVTYKTFDWDTYNGLCDKIREGIVTIDITSVSQNLKTNGVWHSLVGHWKNIEFIIETE